MMSRYFVIVQVPSETAGLIKTYFKNKFSREMSATHIHMSLLPPFFLKEGQTEENMLKAIREVGIKPFVVSFVGVRVSTQKARKYLFLNVGPEDSCRLLSSAVEEKLVQLINIDKTPYVNDVVPQFEPHVTIDYNFEGIIPDDFPDISFLIDKVSVAKEVNGEWVDLVR